MNDESDVRIWLATAEVPDLRPLDFEETVTAGRTKGRRQRTGRIAGTAALVLAALLAVPGTLALLNDDTTDASPAARRTPPPDGPFSCTYQALPVPTGLDAIDANQWHLYPDGMDPSGRYVITQAMSGGGGINSLRVPVLWDNGVGRVISPDLRGRPTVVSENGVVAGERMPGGGTWIYRDGTVSDLAVPAGATGVSVGIINANGDLLGTVYTTAPNTMKVAIWKADDLSNPRTLDAPGDIVSPVAFLPDGGVVGWQSIERRPYVWNADGVGTAYPAPPGAIDYRLVGVGGGYVYAVGKRSIEADMTPLRWKIGTGAVEWLEYPALTPPVEDVEFERVGANGAQLLLAADSTGSGPLDNVFRSFVVRGEHVAQLPAPDGRQATASVMNEFGTKAAGMVSTPGSAGGTSSPAVWTC